MTDSEIKPSNFIHKIVDEDMKSGKFDGRVHTRFPPEPNGYLHIGHAKSILLNYGTAEKYGGKFNLRFDDTNPLKEEQEYIDAIIEDVRWLGADFEDRLFFASNYFEQLYEWATWLIRQGNAYVDDLSAEQIREYRGTLTEPGKNSPFRDRSIEENLDLFARMRAGEFPDGTRVLRSKIDMASPNMNLRDPVLYRILHAHHPRTGDDWSIYPMYDWAHGQSDSIEGITHSLCTLEFEDHRPLYDWFLDNLDVYHHPQQIEFSRFNLTHTIMSKRKFLRLVNEGHVDGWDDPRLSTLRGMRRRGYRPEAIREFMESLSVAKSEGVVELAYLEHVVRDDLNHFSPRAMAVLRPLRVVIENYPEDQVEEFEVPNYPQDKSRSETRKVPFSRVVYIEQEDFMEEPVRKFFRLSPGREVRLIGAYYITCQDVIKDEEGNIVELRCTYDPDSRGGSSPDRRKV
jgi:glutaminyl-tRNA synthetase